MTLFAGLSSTNFAFFPRAPCLQYNAKVLSCRVLGMVCRREPPLRPPSLPPPPLLLLCMVCHMLLRAACKHLSTHECFTASRLLRVEAWRRRPRPALRHQAVLLPRSQEGAHS